MAARGFSERTKRRLRRQVAHRLVENIKRRSIKSRNEGCDEYQLQYEAKLPPLSQSLPPLLLPSSVADSRVPTPESSVSDDILSHPLLPSTCTGNNSSSNSENSSRNSGQYIDSDSDIGGQYSDSDLSDIGGQYSDSDSDSQYSDSDSDIGIDSDSGSASNDGSELADKSSPHTKQEYSVALLSIFHKHHLTYSSLADILQLLKICVPNPHDLPSSVHVLINEYTKKCDIENVVHRCCGNCSKLLEACEVCPREECRAAELQNASFIEIPIDQQVKDKFKDPKFIQLLQYRFGHCGAEGQLTDIHDGAVYKKHQEFFSSKYNISFTVNYDGAPKFKCSGLQIWPIQFVINELPPKLRTRKEYMLLGGLWCSIKKPPSFSFLEPILKKLKMMETDGIVINEQAISKAMLICAVADLPAKAMLMNCNQYNGMYGCSTCKHPGTSVKVGRGCSRVYGFSDVGVMREHNTQLEDSKQALERGKIVDGVKGYSPLNLLPSFDIIKCIPVDYMHCVLLGVMKKLLFYWFDSSNHKNEWYLGRKASIDALDRRLLKIKPPHTFGRAPRSINTRVHWKASELKYFLLYYLPTTLYDILPSKFFVHVLLLSKAIRLLLSETISEANIVLAEKLLTKFCKLHEEYYGLTRCGINIHMLLHLPFCVRNFGPLWTHSSFPFEGQMHSFLQHSHATHGVANQIVSSTLLEGRLHVARRNLIEKLECTPMKYFLGSFQSSSSDDYACIRMLGKSRLMILPDDELQQSNQLLHANGLTAISSAVQVYHKVVVNGQIIQSSDNKRVKKRNSCTVAFIEDDNLCYGIVRRLIQTPTDDHQCTMAVVTFLNVQAPHGFNLGITEESMRLLYEDFLSYELGGSVAIFVQQIQKRLFNIDTVDRKFLTSVVNSVERE